MSRLHFLNVLEGDCTIIQHNSSHVSVVDVCNGNSEEDIIKSKAEILAEKYLIEAGNYNQKENPVNPISYMSSIGVKSIFRFILTHPDMDHMDGIAKLFDRFKPRNFWNVRNSKQLDLSKQNRYSPDDWEFYKQLREAKDSDTFTRLELYSGSTGKYFNRTEEGNSGGDGIYILSPTKELVSAANDIDDYNDCSYVLLYISSNRKILLAGDSHDETWEHIIETHEADVTNVDLLIAPHHGRDSDMDFSFLDTLNPKVTLFGNAKSKHLAYSSWNNRGLFHITNNQAGNVIVDINEQECSLYVTNYKYAKDTNDQTTYSDEHNAYYVGYI